MQRSRAEVSGRERDADRLAEIDGAGSNGSECSDGVALSLPVIVKSSMSASG
jgi:hypothetical protein